MKPHAEDCAMLERMERAQAQTEHHLAVIERQIAARAERIAVSTHVKTRQFGRGTTRWSRTDERTYQDKIAALRFARRTEIEALSRKLMRQAGAIAAYRIRYRIGVPVGEDA